MSKYLTMGAIGFLVGMKYHQLGRRRCMAYLRRQIQRMMP